MAREEPRMARLQDELLVAARFEHREVVVVDDAMPRDAVDERRVGKFEEDLVTRSKLVDVRERREVRRAMPRDVDELLLAGHERLQVAPRPAAQVGHLGAVDHDHVDPEPRDLDSRNRVAVVAGQPVPPGFSLDVRDDRLVYRRFPNFVGAGVHAANCSSSFDASCRCSYAVYAVVNGSFQK